MSRLPMSRNECGSAGRRDADPAAQPRQVQRVISSAIFFATTPWCLPKCRGRLRFGEGVDGRRIVSMTVVDGRRSASRREMKRPVLASRPLCVDGDFFPLIAASSHSL